MQTSGERKFASFDEQPDDSLIDVTTLAQLNAIRHDLNDNGDATHADYVAAFGSQPRRLAALTDKSEADNDQ